MRTIEIDLEIHKRIEAERTSFDETPNAVLRRLLKLPDLAKPRDVCDDGVPTGFEQMPPLGAWTGEGVTLPNGTQLRMQYNDRWHYGEIQASSWAIEGKVYASPSSAAVGCAVTKDGTHPSLNGWIYWEFMRPGETRWRHLSTERDHAKFVKNGVRPATLDELGA